MSNRLLLCFTTILVFQCGCFAQQGKSSGPTMEETRDWITGKIVEHSWTGEGYTYKYSISFPNEGAWANYYYMIVEQQDWSSSNTGFGDGKSSHCIHIADIIGIYFTKKKHNTWMNIRLKEELAPLTYLYSNPSTESRELSFIMNNSILEDNLPDRMKKAFSALVVMCGGKPFNTKEAY